MTNDNLSGFFPHSFILSTSLCLAYMDHRSYEPVPRFGHVAVGLEGLRVYLWGGVTEDVTQREMELRSSVELFDLRTGIWVQKSTKGTPPSGLYLCAYTLLGDQLYTYGGWDGSSWYNNVHCLNLKSLTWRELEPTNPSHGPLKKNGAGMVSLHEDKLVLFGGYGIPTGGQQPAGAKLIRNDKFSDGRGHTNELHVFNLERCEFVLLCCDMYYCNVYRIV